MYFTYFYTRLRQSIQFFGSATNWAIAQLGNRFNFPTLVCPNSELVASWMTVDSELCHLLWAISVRSRMSVACGSKSWLCMLASDSAVHLVINYYIPCLHVEEHTKRFLRIFVSGHGCWRGYNVAKVFRHDKAYIFCSVTSDSFQCQ